MKKILVLFTALSLAATVSYAQKGQRKNAGAYTYTSECMGVEGDGSQTMKVWGTGKNRMDAVEQARKNGVKDIIFNGNLKGSSECNLKPLLFEVNAREKYEVYFNKFFADKGPYNEFVNNKDESLWPKIVKDKKKNGSEVTEGVIVRILRSQLKERLIKDNILVPAP